MLRESEAKREAIEPVKCFQGRASNAIVRKFDRATEKLLSHTPNALWEGETTISARSVHLTGPLDATLSGVDGVKPLMNSQPKLPQQGGCEPNETGESEYQADLLSAPGRKGGIKM